MYQGSTEIASGTGEVTWKSANQFSQAVTKVFTVKNTGATDLVLQPITISNTAYNHFGQLYSWTTSRTRAMASFSLSLPTERSGTSMRS